MAGDYYYLCVQSNVTASTVVNDTLEKYNRLLLMNNIDIKSIVIVM